MKDLITLSYFKFASISRNNIDYNFVITLSQEIKSGENFNNKVFNLLLASKKINEYDILPNEIFSFWKIVGNPNYDFLKSRTIQNNQIMEDVGGGICQVSGIIYCVSIVAGLQILERHNHSMDIYTDETRFAPLGSDATVVYGYKDLRIKNDFPFPVKFKLEVIENQLNVHLLSTEIIEVKKLIYESQTSGEKIIVKVSDEKRKLINTSIYKKNQITLPA